ncbi:TPA: integrase [Vibrio parahaemolyticus]|uniref:hypothetical protein n=1 Tax=Vibrio parahaemolyticus TaxID=670 RepID=UPI0004D4C357|nr:hypothetical protein [Vibrio parahaemolyticus]EGQ7684913.1 integrase [Vibrio parahaemolyticus]EGQ7836100.1 integrase [Vibrio parahaemolyticus]EGQ8183907.1 integrase [Vibrio parahaemolyticus]EJD0681916.1 integrase [Vibrio parahaemolyticus]EJI6218021.1 integrase [Vibrio parahaemolyticus]
MLELIKDIESENITLDQLDNESFRALIDESKNSKNYTILKKLAHIHTGIYEYQNETPYWLKSEFSSSSWVLNFGKKDSYIEWADITLEDGSSLASPQHNMLLNAFKYWILAAGDPLAHGGRLVKKQYVYRMVTEIITLINAILLHSKVLKLSKLHLGKLNFDFWISIFVKLSVSGGTHGIYDFTTRVRELLLNKIDEISDDEANAFAQKNPYITRTMSESDCYLKLSVDERLRACCWLNKQGYYLKSTKKWPLGNGVVIKNILLKGKIIQRKIYVPTFPELWLEEKKVSTEYKPVETYFSDDDSYSSETLRSYINALKLISEVLKKEDASHPDFSEISNINVSKVMNVVNLRKSGRTRTLPPKFVFNLIRSCYEFSKELQDPILNSVLNVLSEVEKIPRSELIKLSEYPPEKYPDLERTTKRSAWIKKESINFVDHKLRELGVRQVERFDGDVDRKHERIRHNESLLELYKVLLGCLQILAGAIMARRQDEFITLKSYGNLLPNSDPTLACDYPEGDILEEGKTEWLQTEYSLKFKVKKSGVGGKLSTSAEEIRPIPRSIAGFIWKLEQFNKKLIELGIADEKEMALFNNIVSRGDYSVRKTDRNTYNGHLDSACDYFEVALVLYDNNEYRRNYVRQHQLRRFFAMCFFWSSKYDGLDTLRWMLGHTDLEHLYNYISEADQGAVLTGVKASYIVRGVLDKSSEMAKLNKIDELESILAQRLNISSHGEIDIQTLSEAVEDYDFIDYDTTPNISQLKAEAMIENEIVQLLREQVITLEPEFFTIKGKNGELVNSYNLILTVNSYGG